MKEPRSTEPLRAEIVDDIRIINGAANQSPPALVITDTSAVAAFVLSILSWIVLPVIGAIAALIIAPKAKRRIRQSNGMLAGKKLASIAQKIAVLNLLASVVVIYLLIALIRWVF